MCEAIYIGNTHKTFKKKMDGHFSDILRLIKNAQKSDSFDAHFKQNFNDTTSRIDPCKYMEFKEVKKLNPIDAIKKLRNLTTTYV